MNEISQFQVRSATRLLDKKIIICQRIGQVTQCYRNIVFPILH